MRNIEVVILELILKHPSLILSCRFLTVPFKLMARILLENIEI
jgi:hypothetical protein